MPTRVNTALETALKHDRWLTVSALSVVVLLCWSWIVPMARDMYGSMQGTSAWMMTGHWDGFHLLLLFAMWAVMMIGMMLPSAAPTLLLYAAVVRKSGDGAHTRPRVYAFAAGYLAMWTLFSGVATGLQRVLSEALLLSPMMELQNRTWAGSLLVLAGIYQLTPLKRTCLDSCRSPVEFITRYWRNSRGGAFRMGLMHGLYCLGCCWALMLLLFVGGVMNLWVIAAITLFVLLEKVAPRGAQGGRLSGALLILLGLWTASANSLAARAQADPQLNDPGIEARISSLLQQMTLEEKLGQLNQFASGQPTGPGTGRSDYGGSSRVPARIHISAR